MQKKKQLINKRNHTKNIKIMADEEGPQAPVLQPAQNPQNPQNPPAGQNPQNQNPQNPPPPQNPFLPNAPQAPAIPYMPPLNWSHFKPEYSGKPDKDAEAHLLRMNEWMDTHGFPDHKKVQRFCLTVVGEVRVWYESLRPINVDWVGLQNIFRQNTLRQVTQGNTYFMCGDCFTLMKTQK